MWAILCRVEYRVTQGESQFKDRGSFQELNRISIRARKRPNFDDRRSFGSYQVVYMRVDFDNYVLVFVKQRGAVHLPGDEAFPTGCRVLELEEVEDLRAESCGRSHAK